jgi:hypothetical protein
MTGTEESEPYANTRCASFIEGGGPTYVLLGSLVQSVDINGVKTHNLISGGVLSKPIDECLVPFCEWIITPRSGSQVREWLIWDDATPGFLKTLLKTGLIAKVSTFGSLKAAWSLRGYRLTPMCSTDSSIATMDGFIEASRESGYSREWMISLDLSDLLFGVDQSIDIPSAINSMAVSSGRTLEEVARWVLSEVPMLIEYGFIRLEPVRKQPVLLPLGAVTYVESKRVILFRKNEPRDYSADGVGGPGRYDTPAEPYALSPSASFTYGGGYIYAIVGDDPVRPLDEAHATLYRWFSRPRSHRQVSEWLLWAEEPTATIDALIERKVIVRINRANPLSAAKSMRGIRLVPLSLPDTENRTLDGFTAIKRTAEHWNNAWVLNELAEILWGGHPHMDVPAAVKFTAHNIKLSRALTADRLFQFLPDLIDEGHIRLEWLDDSIAPYRGFGK